MPTTLWVETLDMLILIHMRLFAGMFQYTLMSPLIKNHVKNVCQDWILFLHPRNIRYVIIERLLAMQSNNMYLLGLWDCNGNQMWHSWLHWVYYNRGSKNIQKPRKWIWLFPNKRVYTIWSDSRPLEREVQMWKYNQTKLCHKMGDAT